MAYLKKRKKLFHSTKKKLSKKYNTTIQAPLFFVLFFEFFWFPTNTGSFFKETKHKKTPRAGDSESLFCFVFFCFVLLNFCGVLPHRIPVLFFFLPFFYILEIFRGVKIFFFFLLLFVAVVCSFFPLLILCFSLVVTLYFSFFFFPCALYLTFFCRYFLLLTVCCTIVWGEQLLLFFFFLYGFLFLFNGANNRHMQKNKN